MYHVYIIYLINLLFDKLKLVLYLGEFVLHQLNYGSEKELQKLNTIGPKNASFIVAYRNQHGPFKAVSLIWQFEMCFSIAIKCFSIAIKCFSIAIKCFSIAIKCFSIAIKCFALSLFLLTNS